MERESENAKGSIAKAGRWKGVETKESFFSIDIGEDRPIEAPPDRFRVSGLQLCLSRSSTSVGTGDEYIGKQQKPSKLNLFYIVRQKIEAVLTMKLSLTFEGEISKSIKSVICKFVSFR